MDFTVKQGSEKAVSRRGSEKAVSRRCLERPLVEYAPLGVRPTQTSNFIFVVVSPSLILVWPRAVAYFQTKSRKIVSHSVA